MAKKNPVREYLQKLGRKGGSRKVPKGFSLLSKKQRQENARKAANARWARVQSNGDKPNV